MRRLPPAELGAALQKGLAPVYLLFGDEPLQLAEAGDAIRQAARSADFSGWEVFFVQAGFGSGALRESANTMSLFSEKRLLDVRFSDKLDAVAAEWLVEYAKQPPQDCLLLLSMGKLTPEDQRKAWFRAVEQIGVVSQAWPLEGKYLLDWLDRRMASKGLLADQSGLRLLAARVEGNLLAAAQEIEKLHVLYGPGQLDDAQIANVVADSARYDVYDLVDAVLADRVGRVCRILDGLRTEGVAPAIVLWALAREARTLSSIAFRAAKGERLETAMNQQRIWESRRNLMAGALRRLDLDRLHDGLLLCAKADRVIKGEDRGDPWEALLDVCITLSGKHTAADSRIA